MAGEKVDRRVKRTKRALQVALVQLIREKGYDAVTIQDITDRANLGRTTFYLHYESKEALLLDHHADLLEHLNMKRWTADELLCKSEARGLIHFLELVAGSKEFYRAVRSARDSGMILRAMQTRISRNLQESLQEIFPGQEPGLPLIVLCNYVAGAQLSLINWWVETRTDYSTADIAGMLQHLQYVAIKDAYQLDSSEE